MILHNRVVCIQGITRTGVRRSCVVGGQKPSSLRRRCARFAPHCMGGTGSKDEASDDSMAGGSSRPPSADSMGDARAAGQRAGALGGGGESSSGMPDSLPTSGSDTDWRTFRARLVAHERQAPHSAVPAAGDDAGPDGGVEAAAAPEIWAHPVPRPERGALLLAHPQMFERSQQYFHQAAILLLDHDAAGSYGVILNRPSDYTLGQLQLSKELLGVFDSCRLYVGGDVGGNSLQILHTIAGLEGSVEVVKGVYMGGIDAATSRVQADGAAPSQFKWFAGYAGWGPGQLQTECQRGVWYTAAASPDLLLQPISSTPEEAGRDPSSGKDYWHKVLTLMSGDYKVLSETIKARQAETAADLSLAADPTLTAAGEAETNTVSESGDEDSRTA